MFFTEISFWPKIFMTKIFFDRKFFWPKILLNKTFLTKNFIEQNFFNQKFFWPKTLYAKKVFSPKLFLTKKNVHQNLFFDQIFFLTVNFLTKNFCREGVNTPRGSGGHMNLATFGSEYVTPPLKLLHTRCTFKGYFCQCLPYPLWIEKDHKIIYTLPPKKCWNWSVPLLTSPSSSGSCNDSNENKQL